MADPSREVYCFVGDGTYLMMPSEIVTAVQEGIKLIIVVVNNHGFASIGGIEPIPGQRRIWHTLPHAQRAERSAGWCDARPLISPPMRAAWARTPSAVSTIAGFPARRCKPPAKLTQTTVIVVEADREVRVPGYD